MSRKQVRAVFFDVGGTLIRPHPSVGAIYSAVAECHGIKKTPDEMESAFRESWAALKDAKLTSSSEDWWRNIVFRTIGQKNRVCFEELYEIFARPDAWEVFPDVEKVLVEARSRGLHVGLISNWDERLRPLLGGLGLTQYFNTITVSCEVGVEKPQAKIFLAALRAGNVDASEAVHVGDSEREDVRGAENVGITGILLDRSGKSMAGIHELPDIWDKLRIT